MAQPIINQIKNEKINIDFCLIHKDKEKAKEMILIFLSFFTKAFFDQNRYPGGWVNLYSKILQSSLGSNYKRIIDECKKNEIIEVHEMYKARAFTMSYRLSAKFRNASPQPVIINNKSLINKALKRNKEQLYRAKSNIIANYLITDVYPIVSIANKEEIMEHGMFLAKKKQKTKKGKTLTNLGKKNRNYWKNSHERVYVQDHLKQLDYLIQDGVMIPKVGDFKSGGRIYDSFNLMPSWVRDKIKINGNNLVELDFSCLHPNLALWLYNEGRAEHISHKNLADYLEIDIITAKRLHLSFFNLNCDQFTRSPIFSFYSDHFPEMTDKIKEVKKENYKKVSQQLFSAEVQLMSNIIEVLSEREIASLYIFDALLVEEKNKHIVKSIMNDEAEKMGVCSYVKG